MFTHSAYIVTRKSRVLIVTPRVATIWSAFNVPTLFSISKSLFIGIVCIELFYASIGHPIGCGSIMFSVCPSVYMYVRACVTGQGRSPTGLPSTSGFVWWNEIEVVCSRGNGLECNRQWHRGRVELSDAVWPAASYNEPQRATASAVQD